MKSTPSREKRVLSVAVLSAPSSTPKTRARAEAWGKKRHFYKPLPKEFPSVCYEVIRIRRREGFEIDGRFVEPAEVYPNSEAWGVDGWTFTTKDAAFAKLREIVASANAPVRFGQKGKRSRLEKSPT